MFPPVTTTTTRFGPGLLALLLWLAGAGGCSPAADAGDLEVSDARIRALIPGRDMTAGYFTVHNRSAADVVLIGADSAAAGAVEMHISSRDGDMMRMRRLDEVVVAAGETVRFEPGGRHLMLFGVSDLGDGTEITLKRRDGEPIVVPFEVLEQP